MRRPPMKKLPVLGAALWLFGCSGGGGSDPEPLQPPPPASGNSFVYPDGPQLPGDSEVPTPWHMTDVGVEMNDMPESLESYCTTFTIAGEVASGVNFYFAPFRNSINGIRFYGGVQTRIDGLRADGTYVQRGRGAIFSRWEERDLDATMPASGGLNQSLGNEGEFISVRNDFAWNEGRYRLCLRKGGTVHGDPLPEDYEREEIHFAWGTHEHTWVRMEATDMQSGATTVIGALAFPGAALTLTDYNILFAEIYALPSPFRAERAPRLAISVENFEVNGRALPYRRVGALSNLIPGSGREPKITRVRYDGDERIIRMETGEFTGRFGTVRTYAFPPQPAVESIALVTAEDQRYVAALWDGRALAASGLPDVRFDIRAYPVDAASVAGMRLELTGPVSMSRLTNDDPYLLSGGTDGLPLPVGDYTVTVTPYAESDGEGGPGEALEAGFSVSAVPQAAVPQAEVPSDGVLLPHIEAALGTTLSANNIAREMKRLERLEVAAAEIADLDGLEMASNLRVLRLPGNRIEDLTPLGGLSALVELDLSNNRITDVGPLAGLSSVERLNLSRNRIAGLEPLAGLASLRRLELAGNRIRWLAPLAGLANLQYLDVSANRVQDLKPLSALLALRYLKAESNVIVDLASLAGLVNLRDLEVSGNRVSELGPLGGLVHLTHLKANRNRLVRLDTLSGLLVLERLELESNEIERVGPLAALGSLAVLHIGGNEVRDFTPLDPLVTGGLEVIVHSQHSNTPWALRP